MSEKRRPPMGMRFPSEFEDALRARSKAAGCFPAQRVQAWERLGEELGLESQLQKHIAQVQAEGRMRQTDGGAIGGQGGYPSDDTD